MSATRTTTRGSGIAAWLASLLVAMVGIGLVIPAGPVTTTAKPVKLIGKRTGDVLVIPALKVRAPLVSIRMDSKNVLSPPRNPREVGYWRGSARPGSTTGQTLITGHTVHTGGGALDRLGTLQPGATVRVVRTSGGETSRTTYVVTAVRDYSKAEISTRATELFGQAGGTGRLVLVTCTGWDGKEYHGNTVVFARPLASDRVA